MPGYILNSSSFPGNHLVLSDLAPIRISKAAKADVSGPVADTHLRPTLIYAAVDPDSVGNQMSPGIRWERSCSCRAKSGTMHRLPQ